MNTYLPNLVVYLEAWASIVALLAFPAVGVLLWMEFFRVCRRKMREEEAEGLPAPWEMRPEDVRRGFDKVREAIPVDDEELRMAKPAAGKVVQP